MSEHPEIVVAPVPIPNRWFDFTVNMSVMIGVLVAIGAFVLSMRDDIRTASTDLKQVVSDLHNENKMQDQSIVQIRTDAANNKSEESNFRSEMRQSVTELQKLLTDIVREQARAAGRVQHR